MERLLQNLNQITMACHFKGIDMTTYTEMLECPQIKTKINSLIGGHIMGVYRNAGMKPPVPFLTPTGNFVYTDEAPQKYANRLREGMKLFAEVLDEIKLNGGENA